MCNFGEIIASSRVLVGNFKIMSAIKFLTSL